MKTVSHNVCSYVTIYTIVIPYVQRISLRLLSNYLHNATYQPTSPAYLATAPTYHATYQPTSPACIANSHIHHNYLLLTPSTYLSTSPIYHNYLLPTTTYYLHHLHIQQPHLSTYNTLHTYLSIYPFNYPIQLPIYLPTPRYLSTPQTIFYNYLSNYLCYDAYLPLYLPLYVPYTGDGAELMGGFTRISVFQNVPQQLSRVEHQQSGCFVVVYALANQLRQVFLQHAITVVRCDGVKTGLAGVKIRWCYELNGTRGQGNFKSGLGRGQKYDVWNV